MRIVAKINGLLIFTIGNFFGAKQILDHQNKGEIKPCHLNICIHDQSQANGLFSFLCHRHHKTPIIITICAQDGRTGISRRWISTARSKAQIAILLLAILTIL